MASPPQLERLRGFPVVVADTGGYAAATRLRAVDRTSNLSLARKALDDQDLIGLRQSVARRLAVPPA